MLSIACLLLIPLLVLGETTHDVSVGKDGLKMDPDNIQAEVGDIINFSFYPRNHSIAQASYETPCEPMSGTDTQPIFSGFFPVEERDEESKQMFSITINNTDTIWLYCSQGSHCKEGQVMVINQK
jgi:plastocyanin